MVEGVARSETSPSILFDHFNRLFPEMVVCSNLILDFSELLVAKRALADTLHRLSQAETLQMHPSLPAGSPLLQQSVPPTVLPEHALLPINHRGTNNDRCSSDLSVPGVIEHGVSNRKYHFIN